VPIGWIADKTSKPATMLACFAVCSLGLIALPRAIDTSLVWPLLLVLGAAGFGIYTIALAQLGDRFSGPDLIAGTAAFSTTWGLGALIGSVVSGRAMDDFGPHGLPYALLAIFVAYLALRIGRGLLRGRW
jgi:predicted MFS family arabinose efflux permease